MRGGRRVPELPDLPAARAHAAAERGRLPDALRTLDDGPSYPVAIAPALRDLAARLDAASSGGPAS